MADIVERLRTAPERLSNVGQNAEQIMVEAADEIERLRKEIAECEERTQLSDHWVEAYRNEIERLRATFAVVLEAYLADDRSEATMAKIMREAERD